MTRTRGWILAAAVCMALGALLVWAFVAHRPTEGHEGPIKNPAPVIGSASGALALDGPTQERIGLRVAALASARLQPEAVAYGHIEEDPAGSFVLRAPVTGTVRASHGAWPSVGQTLTDGAAVGSIEPRIPTADRVNIADRLVVARADINAIAASRAAAHAAYERARTLNADNKIVSDRALQEAEARMKAEDARYAAAEQTVRLLESSLNSTGAAGGPAPLRVERGGQVVEVQAQPGESIESGQPILRVARFDRLLARIDVPAGENISPSVSSARVVVAGSEDHPVRAERVALAAAVDLKTQGRAFLFRIADAGLALRPGQAVTAYLELPGARREGVIVPRSAIVRYAGKAWVYAQSAPDRFARKEISLGEITAGGWFTQSLAPGTRVVVEAAQTLLSEELKSQIQVGEENPQ